MIKGYCCIKNSISIVFPIYFTTIFSLNTFCYSSLFGPHYTHYYYYLSYLVHPDHLQNFLEIL